MDKSSWNNKSSVLKKVKQDGNNLRFASPNLKADRSIVFEAFRETEESIYFADPSLLEDSSFVCKLLKTNIHCYSFLPKNIQTHQECVLTAIKNGNPFFILFNPSILNDSEQNLAFLNATADFFEQHRLTDPEERTLDLLHWIEKFELSIRQPRERSIDRGSSVDTFFGYIADGLKKLDQESFYNLNELLRTRIVKICGNNNDIWAEAVFNNLIKDDQEFDLLIKQKINQIFSCENAYSHVEALFTSNFDETFNNGCYVKSCPMYSMGTEYEPDNIPF